MPEVQINNKQLRQLVQKAANKEVRRVATPIIREKIKLANRQLLENFLKHKITQEIKAGPEAQNTSFTLGGYGNLFSFIGFEQGDDPISKVVNVLKNSITLDELQIGGDVALEIRITMPTKEDFDSISELDLPWASGRSWISAIEEGLSGLGQYLFDEDGFNVSRSDTGIQLKRTIRRGEFRPQKYISEILDKTASRLVSSIKTSVISQARTTFGTI